MNKQRICVVGDGLSGLMTAITLNNIPELEVNLVAKKQLRNKDKRTTAISDTNFKFLKENIKGLKNNYFWPSKKIELFYEIKKNNINFLNLNEKKSNLMHVFENNKIRNFFFKEILKRKINIIQKKIKNLNELKEFDLIILCLGGNSNVYGEISKGRSIKKDYKEIAVTGYVSHKIKNLNTSQFFLKEGPLAILPFSKKNFSFVWSLNKEFYIQKSKNIKSLAQNKIEEVLNTKNNLSVSNIQSYPIFLGLEKNYFKKNILILGEGLHTIHPVAGQGFNLVLRDIRKLKEILSYYSTLGISVKNSYALNDFYESRKPENMIMSLGVDLTHSFFKKNKYLDPLKSAIISNISSWKSLSQIAKKISDKGLY